jgi:hypothetical protein
VQRGFLVAAGAGIAIAMVGACATFGNNDDSGDAADAGLDGTVDAGPATNGSADGGPITDGSADASLLDAGIPLSNLRLWLDAESLARLGIASGSAVPSWLDAHNPAVSASQLTPSAQPTFVTNALGGRPVVRFTSSPESLLVISPPIDSSPPYTLFAVGTLLPTNARIVFLGGGWAPGVALTPDAGFTLFGDSTLVGFSLGQVLVRGSNDQGLTLVDDGGAPVRGSHALTASVDSAGQATARLDGHAIGNGPVPPASFSGVGARAYNSPPGNETFSDGDVAEIILYGGVLSDTDRNDVEAYLRAKYGLP